MYITRTCYPGGLIKPWVTKNENKQNVTRFSLYRKKFSLKEKSSNFTECTRNIHYENTPMQHTAIFHSSKNENFQLKFLTIFVFLLKPWIVGTR